MQKTAGHGKYVSTLLPVISAQAHLDRIDRAEHGDQHSDQRGEDYEAHHKSPDRQVAREAVSRRWPLPTLERRIGHAPIGPTFPAIRLDVACRRFGRAPVFAGSLVCPACSRVVSLGKPVISFASVGMPRRGSDGMNQLGPRTEWFPLDLIGADQIGVGEPSHQAVLDYSAGRVWSARLSVLFDIPPIGHQSPPVRA